jgi:predicted transcriptional regulator
MEKKLSVEEQRAFREISFSIGDEDWHTASDIKGAPIPRNNIRLWMELLVDKGFYTSRKKEGRIEYQITGKGLDLFSKQRDKAERDAQPKPLQYPKEFKGIKTSYYP